jgi:hypothetical protein
MNSEASGMNWILEAFIRDAQTIAAVRGVNWEIELGQDGVALKGHGWNLTKMAKASPPPTIWLNDFGTDRSTVEVLIATPQPGPGRTYTKKPLCKDWQDFIKACAIDQLLVRRNGCGHVWNVVRPLRVLATCAASHDPSAITADDVNLAIEVARKIQPSGQLAESIFGVVRNTLDSNHLIDSGPLFPSLERDKRTSQRIARFVKSEKGLRTELEERKKAEKLPERRAFWELVRIVFTEQPKTFVDLLRFAQVKILILTGFRDGESTLIPADWKRFHEYRDKDGRPAGEAGGISRSLLLRHFAEKQRILNEDSMALFETVQHVPAIFEEVLTSTLDQIVNVTETLRRTLRRQIETGRFLPQYEQGSLVPALDVYTCLTGNPFIAEVSIDVRERFVASYRKDYNPNLFEELRSQQTEAIRSGCLITATAYAYFKRLKDLDFRRANGNIVAWAGRLNWDQLFLRVDDVEDYIKTTHPTKLSDTVPLKLSNGEMPLWQLMFLMPKLAMGDSKDTGLCDITRCCSIGRMDPGAISMSLSAYAHKTLFQMYGQSAEDRALKLKPYSPRHLQNTELFRLGIADTIISKRFNRRGLTQSYEYDHRSLSEELAQIELTPEVEARLGKNSATIARLIKSGKARGPIVDAFTRIQSKDGEDAAFEYLAAEADGFHATPYGHCINSFMVDPCEKHLECFTGCKHLSATDLAQDRQNLVQLEGRFGLAVKLLEARKSQSLGNGDSKLLEAESASTDGLLSTLQAPTKSLQNRIACSIGLDNQLAHAKVRLEGVRKVLATAPGQLVFPDGADLSQDFAKPRKTVLDGQE